MALRNRAVGGPSPASDPVWIRPPAETLAALGATPNGLSGEEAERRLQRDGPNETPGAVRVTIARRVLRKVIEPLVAILIGAAAVSGLSGDWASFAIITVVIGLSITLDVVQEHRAEAACEALKRSVAVRAGALRDGRQVDLPVADLVAGDVVALRAGDLVPADGIVLASHACRTNEALLTGEPYPVDKRPGPCTETQPADAFNALFGGTAGVSGEATMLVTATGARSRFGGIAAALASREAPTAFEVGIHRLGVLILRLTVVLVLFVLLVNLAFGRPALEAFLFSVALAVGLTPELLPMVMTVTLSRGAVRMAARKVVVKRLAAIHDLGSMDVLCTDKTGTLTEARIALVACPGLDGNDEAAALRLAALNSGLATGARSPLDDAILARAADGSAVPPTEGWRKLADIPFDFERRRASVLVEAQSAELLAGVAAGTRLLVVKGAPEEVLALCTGAREASGRTVPLDDDMRARLQAMHDGKAHDGFRLLAVALRPMAAECEGIAVADETGLVFVGYCVFLDPPKPSAGEAIRRLGRAGVAVKIISGDAAPVVCHLAGVLELQAGNILSGAEIESMTDEALAAAAPSTDAFVRVSPDQKTRVVRALRRSGHIVGFMGDGINDAPAIRAADVGLSVDDATDVAREAADMILLAPDLGVLADGVDEGRRTYHNIMKYVRMGTSSNFGNMLSMAVASLVLPFLPLLPIQILINNFLYDASEIGIPFDTVEQEDLRRPRAWSMSDVLRFTLVMGPVSSLFDFLTFAVLLGALPAITPAVGFAEFRAGWFLESMATQILVIFLIRTVHPVWTSRPNPVLVVTSLGALAVALVLPFTPLGAAVGFAPPPPVVLAALAGIVVLYLALAEALKRLAIRGTGALARS